MISITFFIHSIMFQLKYLLPSIILLELLRFSEAYIITVDARAQECFHEKVLSGTKMSK